MIKLGHKLAEKFVIQCAFEPLDERSRERLNRILAERPELAKIYESHLSIRRALKEVEIPPHQLSTERLKEAIVRNRVKTKRRMFLTSFDWSLWSAIAFTACLTLVFGGRALRMIVNRAAPQTPPVFTSSSSPNLMGFSNNREPKIGSTPEAFARISLAHPLIFINPRAMSGSGVTKSFQNSPAKSVRASEYREPRFHRDRARDFGRLHESPTTVQYALEIPSPELSSRSSEARESGLTAKSGDQLKNRAASTGSSRQITTSKNKGAPEQSPKLSSVLTIQPNSKNGTGLPAAKEVSNSQNVALGS